MKTLLIILMAGLCLVTTRASAQILIYNALDGSNGANATSSTASNSNPTPTLGPGWATSNSIVGLASQTLTLTGGTNPTDGLGLFRVGQTGVAGVAGSFSATRTFTGITLLDNTTYYLYIEGSSTTTVALLNALNVGVATTGFNYTAPSASVLGLVDQTATEGALFSFTTGDVNNVNPLSISIAGNTLAAALNNSVSLSRITLSLSPVPEPGSLMLLLTGSLLVLRRRRGARSKV